MTRHRSPFPPDTTARASEGNGLTEPFAEPVEGRWIAQLLPKRFLPSKDVNSTEAGGKVAEDANRGTAARAGDPQQSCCGSDQGRPWQSAIAQERPQPRNQCLVEGRQAGD
jgi:hypothetical protein